MSKPFDIVVHGATGFTGRLVVEHLLRTHPAGGGLRWAMGGRSRSKLEAVRHQVGAPADTPLVVTDVGDAASLQALLAATRLVLTTVGPYQLYGSGLVAACAAAGVDYVALCGEPAWMRRMIDAHEGQAQASGARIVLSCGFDSIPFDLGVFLLQQEMRRRHGGPATRARGRVRRMKGTFSGGTAASLKATVAAATADPSVMALLRNPFSLTPGFDGPPQPPGRKPMVDDVLGVWVAPFVMADINTRNVHRSNLLLGHGYGRDFVYDDMLVTGPGDKGRALAEAVAADRSLGGEGGPRPGEGPSREERESGFFDLLFIGQDAAGHELRVGVTGDRDPGYGSTSKMIGEAAVSPPAGGDGHRRRCLDPGPGHGPAADRPAAASCGADVHRGVRRQASVRLTRHLHLGPAVLPPCRRRAVGRDHHPCQTPWPASRRPIASSTSMSRAAS